MILERTLTISWFDWCHENEFLFQDIDKLIWNVSASLILNQYDDHPYPECS